MKSTQKYLFHKNFYLWILFKELKGKGFKGITLQGQPVPV